MHNTPADCGVGAGVKQLFLLLGIISVLGRLGDLKAFGHQIDTTSMVLSIGSNTEDILSLLNGKRTVATSYLEGVC